MLSGKTQWRFMSTFWHKMSDLKPVCSIKMWKLTEKSYFCEIFEASVHFKVGRSPSRSGKTQWCLFLTQNVPWTLRYFCALSVTFLRLVCILKLEGLLQGYVKWKNTMTVYVNFLTQNVGPWTCYKQFIWGYWPKNHIFVPSPLHFWG